MEGSKSEEQKHLLQLFQNFHVHSGLSITEIREITAKVFVDLEEYIRCRPARRVSQGDLPDGTGVQVGGGIRANVARRGEVFGAVSSPTGAAKDEDEMAVIAKRTPKSPAVMTILKKALIGNAMFSDLDEQQIHDISECMEDMTYKKGDVVFRLGHPGDFFYVVEHGSCEVFLTKEEDKVVHTVSAGSGFGELALLYNKPRLATVKCSGDSRLWRVHGTTFKALVVESTYKKRKHFERLLTRVPLLSALTVAEKSKVADALEEVTFPKDHVIIRENDNGDFFYFLMMGDAVVTKKSRTKGAADEKVMNYTEGDYFGELALLTDQPRRATITSLNKMKCARMHRRDFNRLLGPLQDMLTFRKYEGLMEKPAGGRDKDQERKIARRVSIVADATRAGLGKDFASSLGSLAEESTLDEVEANLEVMSPRAQAFRPGQKLTLENFELGTTLGLGSFGRVRLCRYREDGRHFAVKIMSKSAVLQMKQLEHIQSEKNILLQITYPFVVNLFSTFQDEQNLYMVFEFVCGGEFFTLLRNEDKLPNDQAAFYGTEIALTLGFLHNLNIVYRDLKPENLLIDKEGHLKITDFGFAKIVEDRTWTLCGTPDYIAPEIIRNKGHNKGADWWAFGVLLFEMLAGYPPFYDESGGFGTYKKILKGNVEYPDWFTIDAVDLISKLLVADITKRYGNLHAGAKDIMHHRYFDGIDWDAARKKEIQVPMIPDIEGEDDTSYFEEYDEDDEDMDDIGPEEQKLFANF